MRFEVNGQSYMLSFNSDDSRWYLLTVQIRRQDESDPSD